MSEVLIRALADAQTKIDKQAKRLKSQAKVVRDTEGWNAALNKANEKFLRERDLAKQDCYDAEQACAEAENKVLVLEAATAAQDNAADAMLAKIKDAVYGHGHEYSTILWKVRQIVGPE